MLAYVFETRSEEMKKSKNFENSNRNTGKPFDNEF